ncbi:MAG: ATPase, T2SS/T4P/T4SS family [Planctomycetota bacterium]
MSELHERLEQYVDQNNIRTPGAWAPGRGVDSDAWQLCTSAVEAAWRDLEGSGQVPAGADRDFTVSVVVGELLAAGAVTALVEDATVQRVMVNGPERIFATRNGSTEAVGGRFTGSAQLITVIERMLAAAGVAHHPGATFLEGTLPDGSRVHAAMPAVGGPALTFERGGAAARLADLTAADQMSQNMASFLEMAARVGARVVVSGNSVDARNAVIAAMLADGAADKRVVAVDGGGRLVASHPNVASISPGPGISGSDLVAQALKMGPDRLVVTDVSGAETLQALSALSGATDGGIVGVTAGSPDAALSRLVTQAGLGTSAASDRVEALVRSAVDVVVQVVRYADGRVRITHITDVAGGEQRDVFTGQGSYQGTGHQPAFVRDAQNAGHQIDANIFR